MSDSFIIQGRGAIPGKASGPALISEQTIIGWGGIDIYTGVIVETGHPLYGRSIKDTILILDGSRGSNGWSLFFHAAQVSGHGPAGLIFPSLDSRTAVTGAVLNIPMVTDIRENLFKCIVCGDWVEIDGLNGTIRVTSSGRPHP